MRKNVIVAVGLALSLAGVASAQQGERGKRPEHGGRGGPPASGEMRGRGGPDGLLLKGIELTEGQRTQIAQLGKTQREASAAKREARKSDMEQMRAARQRGDTAAVRAAMQRNRQEMEQVRAQHVAAIRNILTAPQRVQFDRNVAELQERVAKRGAGERPARGMRGPDPRRIGR